MKFLHILTRTAIVLSAGSACTFLLNSINHQSYWHGTIHRVQTVDFNILSHTLANKLSSALIQDDAKEIQHTLDSNFGQFGLVITTCQQELKYCPEQQILFVSNSNREWRKRLQVADLTHSHYDILRNPPPRWAEKNYASTRAVEPKSTGVVNSGQAIGRVYYVRGIPPEFHQDFLAWMMNPLTNNSGASGHYKYTTLFCFTAVGAIWAATEAWRNQKKLAKEREACRKKEAQHAKEREARLREEAQHAKEREQQQLKEIQRLNLRLNEKKHLLEMQQSQQEHWQKEQHHYQQKAQDLEQLIQLLNQQLEALQQQNQQQGETAPSDGSNSIEIWQQDLEALYQELEEARQREENAIEQISDLESSAQKLQSQLDQTRKRLNVSEECLSQIDRDLNRRALTPFEHEVYTQLESSAQCRSGDWKLLVQFDVSQGGESRQFTDFLILGNSFLIVIEVKGCQGKISPNADVKNSPWNCQHSKHHQTEICSAWGINPYHQVTHYANSAMSSVNPKHRPLEYPTNRVYVFEVIVFPDRADLSELDQRIGKYCRISKLSHLIDTLVRQQQAAETKLRSLPKILGANQVEALLRRNSHSS